jgi:hypothetical protein
VYGCLVVWLCSCVVVWSCVGVWCVGVGAWVYGFMGVCFTPHHKITKNPKIKFKLKIRLELTIFSPFSRRHQNQGEPVGGISLCSSVLAK